MGIYVEHEEEIWKCPKHPSKRRRRGVCPACLRNRLTGLCPDCAAVRPCDCAVSKAFTSSSSSSVIDAETSLRRSGSVSFSFLRSSTSTSTSTSTRFKSLSFLSALTKSKSKRNEMKNEEIVGDGSCNSGDSDSRKVMEDFAGMRSRSVAMGMVNDSRRGVANSAAVKRKIWQFPNPMKAYRNLRTPKLAAQDPPPLQRS